MKLSELEARGYVLYDSFISKQECEYFLDLISEYRQLFFVPNIYRDVKPIPLNYSVIDGNAVQSHLQDIQKLYRTINQLINELMDEQLFPLESLQVGCNVNITNKGGTYRWHYDRNAVTALLYLNQVEGGELEFYPNYRIFYPNVRYSGFQSILDRILQFSLVRNLCSQRIVVKPQPGLLVIMRGNQCLHSVRPVTGADDRINIVMAYDLPNANFAIENQLNTYLYSSANMSASDPNYSQTASSYQDTVT